MKLVALSTINHNGKEFTDGDFLPEDLTAKQQKDLLLAKAAASADNYKKAKKAAYRRAQAVAPVLVTPETEIDDYDPEEDVKSLEPEVEKESKNKRIEFNPAEDDATAASKAVKAGGAGADAEFDPKTAEPKGNMNKTQLKAIADEKGVAYDETDTRDEIFAKLEAASEPAE